MFRKIATFNHLAARAIIVTFSKLAYLLLLFFSPQALFTPLAWGMAEEIAAEIEEMPLAAITTIKARVSNLALIKQWLINNEFDAVFNFLRNVDTATQKRIYTTPLYQITLSQNQWPHFYATTKFEDEGQEFKLMSPIYFATYHNNVSALKFFHELGINLTIAYPDNPNQVEMNPIPFNEYERAPITLAAKRNAIEAIEYLHSLKPTGEYTPPGPLKYAAIAGSVGAIECLHKLGARLDMIEGQSAFLYAVQCGKLAAAQYLVRLGARADDRSSTCNFTALHLAIYRPLEAYRREDSSKTVAIIEWLASLGLPLDAQNDQGKTPLHSAIMVGSLSDVTCLLRLGANLQAQDQQGNTPLHLAALEDQALAIELLCSMKANIEARNKRGFTPLHVAVARDTERSSSGIRLLVKNGADIEAPINTKQPLYKLAYPEHPAATPVPETYEGDTPLILAMKKNDPKVIAMLYLLGAKLQVIDLSQESKKPIAKQSSQVSQESLDCIKLLFAIEKFKKQGIQKQLELEELDSQYIFFLLRPFIQVIPKIPDATHLLKRAVDLDLAMLVEHLLPYCSAINTQFEGGDTVLHRAAAQGEPDLVHILFKHPALDYSIKNKQNKTAYESIVYKSALFRGRVEKQFARAIKCRIYLWLIKADIRNERGEKITLPSELAKVIAKMVNL